MKIWENFEKKQLKKGDDFNGQLIYEQEGNAEEDFDFSINREKNMINIHFGHGYIELTTEEFIRGLFK